MTKYRLVMLLFLLGQYAVAQKVPAQLPKLSGIHRIDDPKILLESSFPRDGKIMLVFYDPGCGHCQELGAGVARQADKLGNIAVFFITMNDKEYVEGYINMFAKGLRGRKNISFWKDPGVEFIEKFHPSDYPATYIYDASTRKLVKSFQGESNIGKIL
ncbi:redoxin [Sphingobacterium allocomposti]|nr:redoxin [Sphingobacterium composti Yoo et al. 2007 non Ten et al. 2007]